VQEYRHALRKGKSVLQHPDSVLFLLWLIVFSVNYPRGKDESKVMCCSTP